MGSWSFRSREWSEMGGVWVGGAWSEGCEKVGSVFLFCSGLL